MFTIYYSDVTGVPSNCNYPHKKKVIDEDSLKEAILCFLINNVIRTKRGANRKHRSMMINISVYNIMHGEILDAVQKYVSKLLNIIEQDSGKCTSDFIKNEDMKMLYNIYTGNEDYLDGECDFYAEIREKIKVK